MSVDGQDYADEAVWFWNPQTTRISRKIQKDPESYMVEPCCFWLMVVKIT